MYLNSAHSARLGPHIALTICRAPMEWQSVSYRHTATRQLPGYWRNGRAADTSRGGEGGISGSMWRRPGAHATYASGR